MLPFAGPRQLHRANRPVRPFVFSIAEERNRRGWLSNRDWSSVSSSLARCRASPLL